MSELLINNMKKVHKKEDCGHNISGLASISSAPLNTDFHRLNSNGFNTTLKQTNPSKKTKIMTYESILYLLYRLLTHTMEYRTIIILMRKNTTTPPQLIKMILESSAESRHILLVHTTSTEYIVESYFMKNKSSITFSCIEDFYSLASLSYNDKSCIYMTYLEVSDDYYNLISTVTESSWCVPASSKEIYVSSHNTGSFCHFSFPWSECGTYKGYTIGNGTILKGSSRQLLLYKGSYNYYHSLISSVSYDNSCTDCHEMNRAFEYIYGLLDYKVEKRHKRHMRQDSMKALEKLQEMINNYS